MAQRYGGKYSPQGRPDSTPLKEAKQDMRVRDAAGARANLLFIPPIVLAFTSISAGPVGLALGLTGAGAMFLAAWLLREGLRAEAAYNLRKVARRPAFPRKIFATALTAVGVGLAAFTKDAGMVGAGIYGAIAGALHVTAFGIDPLRDKRVEGVDQYQQDRVAKVVDQAEEYLTSIQATIDALNDRGLSNRVTVFAASARQMIRTVEEDPRDLTRARRYLGVYLMGVRDATSKFADLWRRTQNEGIRTDYEALLTDLEGNFAARTEKLLLDDRSDMDIEINVLRDRLQREGVMQNQGGQD